MVVTMGKGKKRKAPAPLAAQERHKEEAPNLFERLSNKKRFSILGRKVKGETRQLGKLRTAAGERRKNTLLVEYRQLRKSNAFIDRRFGEDDESLTADEKALLRFQKQRLKELAGGKFTLPDEEGGEGGEQLTHMGQSLAELDDAQEGWGSDDEGDRRLDEELTRDFHFGGGLFERKAGGGGGEEGEEGDEGGQPHKKSKKEVMEEVIAKSKAFKAEKQRQREEDADETTALDDQFRSLMGDKALLGLMRKKGEKRDSRADNREDQAFDVLTRELVFEAKAKPGERTLTAEELAELERQRLEALEAQRRRRMQGEDDEGEDEEGEAAAGPAAPAAGLPAGGYAARRAKRARAEEWQGRRTGGGTSGDALEDDFELGSDEEDSEGGSDEDFSEEEGGKDGVARGGRPLTKLELRRQARAAGDHPLQEAFRKASAKLLKKKLGGAAAEEGSSDEGGSEEQDGSSSEDELEGGSGSSEEEQEVESEEGEEEEEEPASDAEAAVGAEEEEEEEQVGGSSEEEQEGSEEDEESEEEEEAPAPATAAAQRRGKATAAAAAAPAAASKPAPPPAGPPGVSADLPYTPPLPESYQAFAKLAGGRGAADLGELVRRVRVVHAASLNSDSRKRLQLLYGILVQHFASLAGQAGGPPLAHLDALVPHLVELTPQVPFYAATLARARLQKAQERLAECLRDPVLRADAWPAPRALLLLKLFATVFPASDKRHPVLTPAGLLACSCLSNCPVARPQHAATGLYLASLAVHLHSEAQRYVPEPLCFAVQLLQRALPAGSEQAVPAGGSHQRQLDSEEPRWLAIVASDAGSDSLPATAEDIEPLELARVLSAGSGSSSSASGAEGGAEYWRSAGFKTTAAAAAARLIGRCAELLAGNAALPEVLAPAQQALAAIVAAAEAAAAPPEAPPPAAGKKQRKLKGKAAAAAAPAPAPAAQAQQPAASLAPGLVQLCRQVLAQVEAAAEAARGARRPMYNLQLLKVGEKRQFNPRFEEGFATGKDYDPDRERSERRKLQRALKKEERGAARELRRDAAFMSDVRDREKSAKQAELYASERRAKSFLQQQQADFKSGGQGGMWKKGKKR